jgi:hypothetical protein
VPLRAVSPRALSCHAKRQVFLPTHCLVHSKGCLFQTVGFQYSVTSCCHYDILLPVFQWARLQTLQSGYCLNDRLIAFLPHSFLSPIAPRRGKSIVGLPLSLRFSPPMLSIEKNLLTSCFRDQFLMHSRVLTECLIVNCSVGRSNQTGQVPYRLALLLKAYC